MRHLIILLLCAGFFTALPPVPKLAEAKNLFDVLFPRATERRRQRLHREQMRRQKLLNLQRNKARRRLNAQRRKSKPVKRIAAPKYFTYKPRTQSRIPLKKLAKTYVAHSLHTELQASEDLQRRVEQHFDVGKMNLDSFVRYQLARAPGSSDYISSHAGKLSAVLRDVRVKAKPQLAKAVVKYYQSNPQFLWVADSGRANDAALSVISILQNADAYGLSSDDYNVPTVPLGGDVEQSARFEFTMTARVLRYMADAKNGVVDPNRISEYHDFSGIAAQYGEYLEALAAAPDRAHLMLEFHPKGPAFAALKQELAALSEVTSSVETPVTIASGTFVRPGEYEPELENIIEAIRRRASEKIKTKHADTLAADHIDGFYSDDVVALVRDMQRQLRLKPDGIVGKNTIKRLLARKSDAPDVKRLKIRLAMERLRWHPDSLGNTHVMINQPAYRASFMRGDKTQLAMNVVVGKPSNQTYFFQDKISYVEFNPYWGIPQSILINEMLPKLRKNSGYLDRLGYEITTANGRRVSSSSVNWYNIGSKFPFNVRQPPGPKNALGRLKIMFPNKHSIYMHDTPARSLFKREKRAFSHGCVRLAEPLKMAAAVLGTSVSDVQQEIDYGENEKRNLRTKIPVYVAYFTAWPDDSGKVQFFADMYSRDKALLTALKSERRVREAAQES